MSKKHKKNGWRKYRISIAGGNVPAPGLRKVRVHANIFLRGGACSYLQVLRELGYLKK